MTKKDEERLKDELRSISRKLEREKKEILKMVESIQREISASVIVLSMITDENMPMVTELDKQVRRMHALYVKVLNRL